MTKTKSAKEKCDELYGEMILAGPDEKKDLLESIAAILKDEGKPSYKERVLCIETPDGNGLTRPLNTRSEKTETIFSELIQAARGTSVLGIRELDAAQMPTSHNITTMAGLSAQPRYAVEYDERYRQVISAVLIRSVNEQLDPVYLMLQTNGDASENEIVNKITLVQGHVNFDKPEHADMSFFKLIKAAANRELREEINIPDGIEIPELAISAFINNETDRINRCHVGFVFTVDLPYDVFKQLTSGEPEKHTVVEVNLNEENKNLDPWAVLTMVLEDRRIQDEKEEALLAAKGSSQDEQQALPKL